MKQLYILETSYNATAASTNRLFAFGRALYKKDVKVTFFYLFPDRNKSKSERDTDIFDFVYLWDGIPTSNKYICTYYGLRKLKKILKPEIPLYVYSAMNCLSSLRKVKGVRLYHEYTECPDVIGKVDNLIGRYFYNQYKKSVPLVDGLFVITPALKDYYIQNFNVAPEKIDVLNVVVDTKRFDGYEDLKVQDCVTYCGIISEFKDGVSVLVKAFAKLHHKYPSYKLQLIGRFESVETENRIRTIAKELEIDDSIMYKGLVSPEEMPRLLLESKILALARPDNIQAKYGFATKIGEYLMTERPFVMTNVGNVQELLKDKEDVIIAQPDNVEDFAAKLIWIADHYEDAVRIAKHGKQTALECFNSEIEANKIYDKIFKL